MQRRGGLFKHLSAQLGVWRQHAMEANQMHARPCHQGSQPLHKLQRLHHKLDVTDIF